MDIVIIVLLVVMLLAMAVMVFFIVRKKPSSNSTPDNVDRLVEKTVESVMAKQMKDFANELDNNNQKSQENLTKFELQTQ